MNEDPVLVTSEARQLLRSIKSDTLIGLRDRKRIERMVFSFARSVRRWQPKKKPLFCSVGRCERPNEKAVLRFKPFLIRRPAKLAIILSRLAFYFSGATGITTYLVNGGTGANISRARGARFALGPQHGFTAFRFSPLLRYHRPAQMLDFICHLRHQPGKLLVIWDRQP
jgi:hypothetical protein